MVVINIRFSEKGKAYKYLLINPKNFKINKDKPLICTKGITTGGDAIESYLYPINLEKVDVLPSVVTSQIVVLNENNQIMVQALGKNFYVENPVVPEKETITKTEEEHIKYIPFIKTNINQIYKNLNKINNKLKKRGLL